MKILHLSTYEQHGGAGRAAFRIHNSLQQVGVASKILVQEGTSNVSVKLTSDYSYLNLSKIRKSFSRLPLRLYPTSRRMEFSISWLPDKVSKIVKVENPDIINLHWISDGFLNIETLGKLGKPIVWTLHDMWPFTGGCHYTYDCKSYQVECGNCPQLDSKLKFDISNWQLNRKVQAWQSLDLSIVTPSKWLGIKASESRLFKGRQIFHIPYGIDTEIYKPFDRGSVRRKLKLPQEKFLLLFGAINSTGSKRKGYNLLLETLKHLQNLNVNNRSIENIELVIFGTSKLDIELTSGFRVHCMGNIYREELLAQIYSAADVFVAPSLQDNLPLTILESLSCTTPCISFDTGGFPDMIIPGITGFLATPYDCSEMAKYIDLLFGQTPEERNVMRVATRKLVEDKFTYKKCGNKYTDLYRQLLAR